jgi:hypothetical protein
MKTLTGLYVVSKRNMKEAALLENSRKNRLFQSLLSKRECPDSKLPDASIGQLWKWNNLPIALVQKANLPVRFFFGILPIQQTKVEQRAVRE